MGARGTDCIGAKTEVVDVVLMCELEGGREEVRGGIEARGGRIEGGSVEEVGGRREE
jgi:hypothetical protein